VAQIDDEEHLRESSLHVTSTTYSGLQEHRTFVVSCESTKDIRLRFAGLPKINLKIRCSVRMLAALHGLCMNAWKGYTTVILAESRTTK
jgi:hypothetical protein